MAEPPPHRAAVEDGMMSRAQIIFPCLIFAVVAALLAAGLFVFHYSWTVIGFPLGAGLFVCLMCVIDVAMSLTGREPKPPANEEPLAPLSLAAVAWAFALVPFVIAFGFVFGPALYLLAYLFFNGASWRIAAVISTASLLVTWGLFIKLMRVPMPVEPLWW
jgi:hypothetical protein